MTRKIFLFLSSASKIQVICTKINPQRQVIWVLKGIFSSWLLLNGQRKNSFWLSAIDLAKSSVDHHIVFDSDWERQYKKSIIVFKWTMHFWESLTTRGMNRRQHSRQANGKTYVNASLKEEKSWWKFFLWQSCVKLLLNFAHRNINKIVDEFALQIPT